MIYLFVFIYKCTVNITIISYVRNRLPQSRLVIITVLYWGNTEMNEWMNEWISQLVRNDVDVN